VAVRSIARLGLGRCMIGKPATDLRNYGRCCCSDCCIDSAVQRNAEQENNDVREVVVKVQQRQDGGWKSTQYEDDIIWPVAGQISIKSEQPGYGDAADRPRPNDVPKCSTTHKGLTRQK